MAAAPELAPADADHILHSTSVVSQADYPPDFNKRLVPEEELDKVKVFYRTFDKSAVETIRLRARPAKVVLGKEELRELKKLDAEGWTWQPLEKGGILRIRHENGNQVKVL